MKTATQSMSITLIYDLVDPSQPFTASGDTPISFSTTDASPPWAWSLWEPKTGVGSLILNNSGDGTATTQLQISDFTITASDSGLNVYNTVSIIIPDGTTFTGMTIQLYLVADPSLKNNTPIDFQGSMPSTLQVTISDANNVSPNCVIAGDDENTFNFIAAQT
jgi:hypothetical protein